MGSPLREQIDGVVVREARTDLVRSSDSRQIEAYRRSEEVAAISRAAHAAARVARSKTVAERAAQLGIGIVKPLESSLPGRAFQERISQEERQSHGYGDLPAALIRTVERSVGVLIPEYSSFTPTGLRFAAAAMHIVSQNPSILLHDIWTQIADDKKLLETLPSEMKPTDLILLEDAVQAAQFHSAEYFTANPEQGE